METKLHVVKTQVLIIMKFLYEINNIEVIMWLFRIALLALKKIAIILLRAWA